MRVVHSHRSVAGLAWLFVALLVVQLGCATTGSSRSARRYFDRAVVFFSRGEYSEAIDEYKLALREDPTMTAAYFGLGSSYIKRDRHERAIQPLERAVELQPVYPEAHFNLGIAYGETGRTEAAAGAFTRALEQQDGDYQEARLALARALRETGDVAAAAVHYQALFDAGDTSVGVELADVLVQLDERDAAVVALEETTRRDATNAAAWHRLGLLREQRGEAARALEAVKHAATLRPDDLVIQSSFARIAYASGDLVAASRGYETVLGLDPGNVEALFNLGVLSDERGDLEGAIDLYQRVLELDPEHADAYLNLGIDLVEVKDYEAAIRAYDQFLLLSEDTTKRSKIIGIVERLRALIQLD